MGLLREIDRFSNNIILSLFDLGNHPSRLLIGGFQFKFNSISYRYWIRAFDAIDSKFTFYSAGVDRSFGRPNGIPTSSRFINQAFHHDTKLLIYLQYTLIFRPLSGPALGRFIPLTAIRLNRYMHWTTLSIFDTLLLID